MIGIAGMGVSFADALKRIAVALERFIAYRNRLGFPNQRICDSSWMLEWRPAWMTRPYSNDLRERVVAAVASGQSCRVVAERFDIAVSSVVKWS